MNATDGFNRGNALLGQAKFTEAVEAFREVIQLKPDYADAHNNLGNALTRLGKTDEAIESYRATIRLKSDHPLAYNNLATALKDRGDLDGAIENVRRAMKLSPGNAVIHSNFLYMLNFLPNISPADLIAEHHQWSHQHADPLKSRWRKHDNQPDPNRRIRVGYVSPDFKIHPIGRFILPLLVTHDRQQIEVYCYSWVRVPDDLTTRCQRYADVWRSISGISDDEAADLIRRDGIDILVDLTMHMDGNRILIFGRKPAPIQVTYLAYAGTTGSDAIDYRLTDPHLDPSDDFDEHYAEKSIQLAQSYWCYKPTIWDISVSNVPSAETGVVTFGCLNNFCKVNDAVLETWARILAAVPNSRLMIHAHVGNHRDRVRRRFTDNGINPERINFIAAMRMDGYMEQFGRIDIGLDTFPYVGGTTTCDALWMGVPVVTLSGETAISRGGVSILSNVGLADLIAETPERYIQIATGLANDADRLAKLRGIIRGLMTQSPLMDAKRFTADVEAAYRKMWRTWCGSL